MRPGDVSALLETIRGLEVPVRLVIFDTLARCSVGADENSTRDMGLVVAGADRVRMEMEVTVLLVHHTRLDGTRERGNASLRGGSDTLVFVSKEDDVITLVDDRQKDDPQGDSLKFQLRVIEFEDGGTSCALVDYDPTHVPWGSLPKTRQQALEALQSSFDSDGATFSQWRDTAQLARATFGRVVSNLESQGLIRKVGKKYVVGQGQMTDWAHRLTEGSLRSQCRSHIGLTHLSECEPKTEPECGRRDSPSAGLDASHKGGAA